MPYTTADIRNLALVGQAGAGKTLLAEALLAHSGAIRSKGSLARGTTVCDFDPQEKSLLHSLDAAICGFERPGSPRQRHRHPGLSGFSRPHAVRARGGRDRGDRRERGQRRRADDAPDDGLREGTRPLPPDRRSTRSTAARRAPTRCSRRSARPSARPACRSTCRPTAARRSSTASSSRAGGRPTFPRSRRRTPRSSTRSSRWTRS